MHFYISVKDDQMVKTFTTSNSFKIKELKLNRKEEKLWKDVQGE